MVTVDQLLFISEGILSGGERKSSRKRPRAVDSFVAVFKLTPFVAMEVWDLLQDHTNIPRRIKPKHFLWTLFFLKHYLPERATARLLGCDRKTLRYYVWRVVGYIAFLRDEVVGYICFVHALLC